MGRWYRSRVPCHRCHSLKVPHAAVRVSTRLSTDRQAMLLDASAAAGRYYVMTECRRSDKCRSLSSPPTATVTTSRVMVRVVLKQWGCLARSLHSDGSWCCCLGPRPVVARPRSPRASCRAGSGACCTHGALPLCIEPRAGAACRTIQTRVRGRIARHCDRCRACLGAGTHTCVLLVRAMAAPDQRGRVFVRSNTWRLRGPRAKSRASAPLSRTWRRSRRLATRTC